ncbi:MAG: DEAD/DEAH box helicase, partial [Alphaproteobacteria bacterium]|nr:DEAD/DEAH box helicase [Alphaproteobacteria bacterium]
MCIRDSRRAVDLGIRALSVDSETLGVWVKGGARRLEDLLRPDWAGETGPAVQLLEMFPEMATVLRANAADRLYARACENLRLELAGSASPIPCFAQEQVLLVDWEKLEAMSFHDRLKAVLREICAAGWSDRSLDDALRWILSDGSGARRRRVFEEPDLERRLLAAIGGRIEVLYETFDESVTDALDRKISDFQIASLALAIHGPTLLYLLRDSMESEGLKPPGRWGTSEAEQFVREIGFPNSFAASSQERHSPEIVVSGPFQLPPLHDFQEEIFHAIDSLMQKDDSRRRAVVSLPTGGGKTRVVVEAAVKLVLAKSGGGMKRSVLWVAQTNELCEQAVQCFRQVWSNHGSEGADLRIARLWGGSRSPREPEAEEAFVAVASIQTLNNRFDSELLTWLSHSSVVIVDECHHAIARSYSDLLRWLDATLGDQRRKDEVVEPVIIGLSATPFRGHDEDESNRLAARFDRRWLPRDHSGLYKTLRDMDVLARSNYEPLWYGGDFQFTEEERKEIEQFNEFPDTAAERLALDNARNDVIVKQVVESSCDSILLFANSVAHAKYLATRLHLAGVSAAAISSETKRAARRYFIRSFQEGKIRVLCNHSVLVAGFDAPKTDMILISRPVFSPVRYMQMVGRGLRGPANGGTPVCTILTVLDNLSEFQDRLPYEYCARFFSED